MFQPSLFLEAHVQNPVCALHTINQHNQLRILCQHLVAELLLVDALHLLSQRCNAGLVVQERFSLLD